MLSMVIIVRKGTEFSKEWVAQLASSGFSEVIILAQQQDIDGAIRTESTYPEADIPKAIELCTSEWMFLLYGHEQIGGVPSAVAAGLDTMLSGFAFGTAHQVTINKNPVLRYQGDVELRLVRKSTLQPHTGLLGEPLRVEGFTALDNDTPIFTSLELPLAQVYAEQIPAGQRREAIIAKLAQIKEQYDEALRQAPSEATPMENEEVPSPA